LQPSQAAFGFARSDCAKPLVDWANLISLSGKLGKMTLTPEAWTAPIRWLRRFLAYLAWEFARSVMRPFCWLQLPARRGRHTADFGKAASTQAWPWQRDNRMQMVPCPDCGGQGIAHCCHGICEQPDSLGGGPQFDSDNSKSNCHSLPERQRNLSEWTLILLVFPAS
jgi:hypothetical protein